MCPSEGRWLHAALQGLRTWLPEPLKKHPRKNPFSPQLKNASQGFGFLESLGWRAFPGTMGFL